MTEFTKLEFFRLIEKLKDTDPSTTAYHILLQSIESFDSIAKTVDDIAAMRDEDAHEAVVVGAGWVKGQEGKVVELTATIDPDKVPVHPIPVVPFEATDFPAETTMNPPEDKKNSYDPADVRKALLDARGRGVNVKEILRGFGADGFQAVPAEKYGALMEALAAV